MRNQGEQGQMASTEPVSRWTAWRAPAFGLALPAAAEGNARQLHLLVPVLPILLLPQMGTPEDLLRLGCLLLAVLAIDLGLATRQRAVARRTELVTAAAGIALGTGMGIVLGTGVALALALYAGSAALERDLRDGDRLALRLVLRALAVILLLDLALVDLGAERGPAWLALGAGIGLMLAAADELRHLRATARAIEAPEAADDGALLEALVVGGALLAAGAYAALLGSEPDLLALAPGSYLTLPLFTVAAMRLAWLALADRRQPDAPALVLLLAWALAASGLLEA